MPSEWVDEGPVVSTPGGILLSSFPSAGLAATVAAHYIVQTLKLPRIGYVESPDSPTLAIVQNGRVNPPVRAHGRADLTVVLSELPVPPDAAVDIARAILGAAEARKVRLIIGLEGVVPHPPVPEDVQGPESVWAVLSRPDAKLQDQLKGANSRALEDGVIGGVSGALLVESLRRSTPTAVLLVSARPVPEGYPDHRAGAALIEVLDRLLPELQIDTRPLRTQAEMIERALRSAMKTHRAKEPMPEGQGSPTIYG
ncbi:MAG TPA: PAC2 family protein [Thermoplasmata archaeon]|nr:PAC2 family protein [Thermoplasmata archaeon]